MPEALSTNFFFDIFIYFLPSKIHNYNTVQKSKKKIKVYNYSEEKTKKKTQKTTLHLHTTTKNKTKKKLQSYI